MQKIICIIQARTGSTRLPNKIFLPLQGKAMLLRVVDRVLQSKYIRQVIVATTVKENDQKIVDLFQDYNSKVKVTRGSEEDVLDRYYQAGRSVNLQGADAVVRITSDNPLIDPELIDQVIAEFLSDPELDYVSTNIGQHTFPRGTDVEVIKFSTLEQLWKTTTEPIDREHVTIHIKLFPAEFRTKGISNKEDWSHYRWTVDEKEDYELAKIIYERLLSENPQFRMADVVRLFKEDPELFKINRHIEQKNAKY